MLKAVIFDMDGVLIDSEPVYMDEVLEMIEKMCQKDNYPFDYEKMKKSLYPLVGSPNQKTFDIIAECLDNIYTADYIRQTFDEESKKLEPINYRNIVNPHLLDILPRLKKEGLKLAIASSSPLENIMQVVKECDIEKYFDSIISGLEFKESKPNPEIYLVSMKKLGVSQDEAIAIEDSSYGIEACNRAGLKVIAKYDNRFSFDQSHADYLVYDLLQAYHIIHGLK